MAGRSVRDVTKTSKIMLLIVSSGVIILVGGWYIISLFFNEDFIKVLISTDKEQYQVGEIIHIHIQNWDDRTIDIYCPMNCALGNFPTTVEKYQNGEWEYLAGFCPSIEPLFGNYKYVGDYIIHSLAPGSSYDLEISNLEAMHLQGDVRLRIMYYLNSGRSTIYSHDFTVKP
jgi:hypothetical protein